MAKIFISYSSQDRPFAIPLYSALEDAGHDVWMDQENLEGGDAWLEMIQTNILWADSVVVVWSASALESRWVKAEINFAHSHNKQIIPLQIDETDGSEHIIINSLQVINARIGGLGAVLRKIEIALMSNPEVTVKIPPVGANVTLAQAVEHETPRAPRRSRTIMIGVVIVLVLLVGMLPMLRPTDQDPVATTLTVPGSVTAATEPATVTASATPERITLDSLNQWRQANQLPPLQSNAALTALADQHMRYLRAQPLSVEYDEYVNQAEQDGQTMAAEDGYSGAVLMAVKITDGPAPLAELVGELVSQGGENAHTDFSEAGFASGQSFASGKYYYVLFLGAPA